LLDVVDSLIDKGVALDAEVVLGLADVDLLYLRAGALLAAADRVFPSKPGRRGSVPRRGAADHVRQGDNDREARRHGSSVARHGGLARTERDESHVDPVAGRVDHLREGDGGREARRHGPSVESALSPTRGERAPVPADETSRSVIRLVLTLVEFIRQLLERQAVRRVREKTLTPAEIERLGTALMQLEATVHELAERHGLDPDDLNLDLGPLGTLR
jgi:hypothetical protein